MSATMTAVQSPKNETVSTPAVESAPAAVAAAAKPAKVERKGKQISATVTPEFFEELDALHWELRMNLTDLVRTAVEEFAAKHKVAEKA